MPILMSSIKQHCYRAARSEHAASMANYWSGRSDSNTLPLAPHISFSEYKEIQ